MILKHDQHFISSESHVSLSLNFNRWTLISSSISFDSSEVYFSFLSLAHIYEHLMQVIVKKFMLLCTSRIASTWIGYTFRLVYTKCKRQKTDSIILNFKKRSHSIIIFRRASRCIRYRGKINGTLWTRTFPELHRLLEWTRSNELIEQL